MMIKSVFSIQIKITIRILSILYTKKQRRFNIINKITKKIFFIIEINEKQIFYFYVLLIKATIFNF